MQFVPKNYPAGSIYWDKEAIFAAENRTNKPNHMKKTVILSLMAIGFIAPKIHAQQAGPYKVNASEEFESPKHHDVMRPIAYGKDGIIQVNAKGVESFSFQQFSNDLKLERENTVSTEGQLNEHTNYDCFVKFRDKSYLFVRDVNRDAHTEGISALEFLPKDLAFVPGKAKELFQSSDKVNDGQYEFDKSNDKTKFLYTYRLVPREKKDALNKDVIGMYVYDQDLNKIMGGEYEMPYTEAMMDNLGYTVSDDGKIYLLARVYDSDDHRLSKNDVAPNYHFEVLMYDKTGKKPKSVEVKIDSYFPKSAYIYEDGSHNIAIAGFYSKGINKPVDGAYIVRLDFEKKTVSKVNGGYYEIPSDIIKSYTSDREKRKMEKKESKDEDNDLGVDNLTIRGIYETPDGSVKIVAEQYVVRQSTYYDAGCKCYHTRYDTYADDIFVMSINGAGKLDWVKKIPKRQHAGDPAGQGLSINTIVTGNDLNIFFIDNIKNIDLPPTEAPKVHENRKGGYLVAVNITEKGDVKKYNLGEIDQYETNFFIRGFVDGGNHNLISTERKKRKNKLFSIEVH